MRFTIATLAIVLPALASACVQATPDKELRVETEPPADVSLCERMAEDFEMVVAEDSALRGRLYRVSHADRLISARGVSWGFRLIDEDPATACETTANGSSCAIEGPAEFHVESNAGRAVYQVRAGDRA
ncbi:MAG: hypothetical protein PVI23_07275, partial [Maricaulaceae bacterium]